jgi:uncharacterized membrane protein
VTQAPTEGKDSVGLDRILFFGDAVVAIAITLLALPLVDAALRSKDAADFFRADSLGLLSAAISFWMIAAAWRNNHQLFRRATGYNAVVLNVALAWIAAIVALPIATALIVGGTDDRLALIVYLGVFTVSAGLTRVQHEVLERSGLLDAPKETRLERALGWLPIALRALILVLVAVLPQGGLWWLLLLTPGPIAAAIARRVVTRRTSAP